MSQAKEKLKAFLGGLDSGDISRLKDYGRAAIDEYVPDTPGPDFISRPLAKEALDRMIDDYTRNE